MCFTCDDSSSTNEISSTEYKKIIVGPPKLTAYEKAMIIGVRALQISLGAPVLINVNDKNLSPIEIAKIELEKGFLPITIRRIRPDNFWQDIPLSWLIKK
ncbi:MAG: DNA-directed RNA polymerase subunit K [Candidatus Methanomethylicia archaeon]|nr:DNA-directed RNA polymerase subunit K [Candidatus Methanomethylicia archaeon]MDW7988529.1 DNA-directed RNA polymerase subunit K [Nitrososphaerota archaeon]